MCRWMAWLGQHVLLEELLFKTQHGLIDQSLHSRMGAETTNGDGFGVGWYGDGEGPALYKSVSPAWGDANLRELAGHISRRSSSRMFARRPAPPVQQTNCHPFRHGSGCSCTTACINGFHAIRRDLVLAVDPELFPEIQGSTDSEVLFHLALTFGLEDDPIGGARARDRAGRAGRARARHRARRSRPASASATARRVGRPLLDRGHVAHALRLGRRREPAPAAPREPAHPAPKEGDRVIVSEPLADLPGAWHEVPESSALVAERGGELEHRPFRPRVPA